MIKLMEVTNAPLAGNNKVSVIGDCSPGRPRKRRKFTEDATDVAKYVLKQFLSYDINSELDEDEVLDEALDEAQNQINELCSGDNLQNTIESWTFESNVTSVIDIKVDIEEDVLTVYLTSTAPIELDVLKQQTSDFNEWLLGELFVAGSISKEGDYDQLQYGSQYDEPTYRKAYGEWDEPYSVTFITSGDVTVIKNN